MTRKMFKNLIMTTLLLFTITGCGENADIQPSGNGGSINTGETGNSGNTGGNGSSNSSDNSDTNTSAPIGTGNSSTEIYGDTAANLYGAGGAIDSTGKYSNPNTGVDPETGRGGFINNVVTPTLDAGNIVAENDIWVIYEDGTAVDKKHNTILGLAVKDTAYNKYNTHSYDWVSNFTKFDTINFVIEDDVLKIKGKINYKQNHEITYYEYYKENRITPIETNLLVLNPTAKSLIETIALPETDDYLSFYDDGVYTPADGHNITRYDLTYWNKVSNNVSEEQISQKVFKNYMQYFSQEWANRITYGAPNDKAFLGIIPYAGYQAEKGNGKNIALQYMAFDIDFINTENGNIDNYENIPESVIYTSKYMYQPKDGSIVDIPVEFEFIYK